MIANESAWPATLGRLWLLRPVRALPVEHAVRATAVLMAACLAFWAAFDRWEMQPDPRFVIDALPLFAWYGLAIIGLAALIRARSRPQPSFAAALALTMGAVPALLILYTVAAAYLPPTAFLAALVMAGAYTFLYLARALRAASGESQRLAALVGSVAIAGFIWGTGQLDVIPDVWTTTEPEPAAPADAADDTEAILFGQPGRIDDALAQIPKDSVAKSRGFFLGFAGVGDEKVFAQEIGLASRVLGERYRIDARTVSLVNDERDLEGAPLATVSGLKYALHGLAERMNPDRDVLFLAISSHGAADPVIAVSNAQLPLQDLSADDLADALRESGIKWRVIIISACYAGAFIDPLKDPQTIVITAAAADRTSFGCSNDRDLTYFGEAFYRDALPEARTLRAAFETAKTAVSARERQERETPSNPQAYFGAKMEEKLATME